MGRSWSSKVVMALSLLLLLLLQSSTRLTMALWCIARSDATSEALQTALDYACSAGGADCAPLQQQTGLCFLPNTIQAHASYAFNSYYMRRFMAPGSCDFSGTATIAKTDPSYGSCVYPPSPSTAGGGGGTTTTTPAVSGGAPPPPLGGGGPIGNDTLDDTPSSSKAFRPHSNTIFFFFIILITIDLST